VRRTDAPERAASAEKNCDTNRAVIDVEHWLATGCTNTAVSVAVIADAPVAAGAAVGRADSCSELVPHAATAQTTQTTSNLGPLRLAVPRSRNVLRQPFMRRTTRQAVRSFQRWAVTKLTNRLAAPAVL
jgi:hypothetical protein